LEPIDIQTAITAASAIKARKKIAKASLTSIRWNIHAPLTAWVGSIATINNEPAARINAR
jgi:hypothetical protein